jgi:ketosteroid isomerase-like protein
MSDNKAIVRTFMQALGTGDAAAMQPLLADDMVAICTGTCLLSGSRNAAEILAAVGMLSQVTQNGIEFKILNLTAEDDRVATEAEGYSTLVNGTPYNNQYHFLFFIRAGKIYKLKEYMDTKLVQDSLGPILAAAGAA